MFETLFVGGGGAGTGPLVHAARHGLLRDWLDRGVAVVDASERMGGGIGRYALNADTIGSTFLECLQGGDPDSPLLAIARYPSTRTLANYRDSFPPLSVVGRFLNDIGGVLAAEIAARRRSRFFSNTQARAVRLHRDGGVRVELALPDGRRQSVAAADAILGLGGRQITDWASIQLAPGLRLDRWRAKLLPSDALLAHGGAAVARRALRRAGSTPRAIILGGAHSAFSAAWVLLQQHGGVDFADGGLQILCRSEPRVFYADAADAAADGYTFAPDDVCPSTGRINRLGGLRGDGRAVWRRINGHGSPPDRRVQIRLMPQISPAALRSLLDAADLIVPAFGYRLASVPIFAPDGRPLALASTGPAVDSGSRLRFADGSVLPNLFGVGLGSGFRPWGAMAGEPSFRGQQNSLWLYQNGLGEMLYSVTGRSAQHQHAPAPLPSRWSGVGDLVAAARMRMAGLR